MQVHAIHYSSDKRCPCANSRKPTDKKLRRALSRPLPWGVSEGTAARDSGVEGSDIPLTCFALRDRPAVRQIPDSLKGCCHLYMPSRMRVAL
jgi:hypothetical protein